MEDQQGPVLLEVADVAKSFGRLRAVDGMSLRVSKGEIVGIGGPNGAGKSTLFNVMTKIPFGPDSGEVLLRGKSLKRASAPRICRSGIARTFQKEVVFDSLSVFDNVRIAAAYGRPDSVRRHGIRQATEEALEFAGLAERRSELGGRLSLLEKKRLMIASAVVTAPDVLLLDEPASGLSEDDQEELVQLIRRVHAHGVTILVIEHVLPLFHALADRLIIMVAGRYLAEGKPAEILQDDRVVEAYVGTGKTA